MLLAISLTSLASQHVFSIKDTKLYVNYQEFKMIGLRCSNALLSDKTARDLIDHLDLYKSHGINTVTVYFMGSRFGDMKGYRPDASLDPVYAERMGRIIEAADQKGMVVLVGCLYWSTSKAKEDLLHWTQSEANLAVANTVKWLVDNNYRNVLVDPDNEGMAVRSNKWRVESMIAAAHQVDPSMMVANNTHQKAGNSDLNIHFGPKEKHKPWLDTEATPERPGGYWGDFSKKTHQAYKDFQNYSRIGRYTEEMKQHQLERTAKEIEDYNGHVLASTWLQCSPHEEINGPFCEPGGKSELGSENNEHAPWNKEIDRIHPDAGILWWMEFIKAHYGPWEVIPFTKVKDYKEEGIEFFIEENGELCIEAENYAEHQVSAYKEYSIPHEWKPRTEHPGYSGSGYLQVLPDEWPEGGSGPSSPRSPTGAIVTYPIRISQPGEYQVYVRGWSMGGESNGVHLGINGILAGEGPGASNMSGFRPHDQWIWESGRKEGFQVPAVLELGKGDHVLYVWNRDDGFCLDKILLKTKSGKPAGIGPEESVTHL